MSDAPTPADAATAPPDPDRAAPAALPRVSLLLGLVRKLVTYGNAFLTTLQQRSSVHRCVDAMRAFGTKDLALIIARITCGLQRAAALEVRLNRYVARGKDLPLPSPCPSAARAYPRKAPPAADAPPADSAALLAALPSAEEIAQQVRTRSLGIVIGDICRDLGLVPGEIEATLWEALMDAAVECGINLVRFITSGVAAAIAADDDDEELERALATWPAPVGQAAIAVCAQPP